MRNGIDAAKAIRLGADLVGQAATLLPAALDGTEALIEEIAIQTEQLRIACFCTGSASLATLRSATLLDAATGKATT
jgi:isopentenyl-diphosphate delta-isomerase